MTARVIVIPDATASTTRVNINDALAALGSTNSGVDAPPDSLNNMLWYDTANHILKIKAEVGADWINIGYLDQGTDTFKILDDTVVITAAGGATNGIIGDQLIGTWETGTGTTESLVSPAKVKAAIDQGSSVRRYTSSLSTWSTNTNYTFTHSLGSQPVTVTTFMQAKSANNGFASGDIIMPGSGFRYEGWGIFINKVTSSSVQLKVNSAGIRWDNYSTNANFAISNSTSWSLGVNVIA